MQIVDIKKNTNILSPKICLKVCYNTAWV